VSQQLRRKKGGLSRSSVLFVNLNRAGEKEDYSSNEGKGKFVYDPIKSWATSRKIVKVASNNHSRSAKGKHSIRKRR